MVEGWRPDWGVSGTNTQMSSSRKIDKFRKIINLYIINISSRRRRDCVVHSYGREAFWSQKEDSPESLFQWQVASHAVFLYCGFWREIRGNGRSDMENGNDPFLASEVAE